MNRRDYLKYVAGAMLLSGSASLRCRSEKETPEKKDISLTDSEVIIERVNKHRPSLGGQAPADLMMRLGTTHVDGKYHLTQEPFLVEGARKIIEFGSRVCKVWFEFKPERKYPFCSDWSALPDPCRLVDLAKHPYYDEIFNLPFSTIILEITYFDGIRPFYAPNNDFSEYEEQFEELADYLYRRFSNRPVTFILQNWEGDWLFNGSYETEWSQSMLDDLPRRIDYFTKWFAAKQRGVEKARKRFTGNQAVACEIIHAVEVNRVLTLLQGTPTLTERVLPNIKPDLISWSCYDGLGSEVDTWHGIELIRHFMKHSGYLSKPTVMIGEIGFPERNRTKQEIEDFWDRSLAVFFAQEIPWIVQWELYCNEPADPSKDAANSNGIYAEEELRGFWLYKPDGSLSHAGRFLQSLMN